MTFVGHLIIENTSCTWNYRFPNGTSVWRFWFLVPHGGFTLLTMSHVSVSSLKTLPTKKNKNLKTSSVLIDAMLDKFNTVENNSNNLTKMINLKRSLNASKPSDFKTVQFFIRHSLELGREDDLALICRLFFCHFRDIQYQVLYVSSSVFGSHTSYRSYNVLLWCVPMKVNPDKRFGRIQFIKRNFIFFW